MAEQKGSTTKLNCDISTEVKIEAAVFATKNQKYLREVVEEALREYLDRRKKNV